MFRLLFGVAILLAIAATICAIVDGKLTILLIMAAGAASSLAGFAWMMSRKLGDAYDAGAQARERAIMRALAAHVSGARD